MKKWIRDKFIKYRFDFTFDSKQRDPEQTATILSQAMSVEGFKEMLANDIYWYKRKAIESKEDGLSHVHYAEAYQRLLDKMEKSREYLVTIKEKADRERIRLADMEYNQYPGRQ